MATSVEDILTFWFGSPTSEVYGKPRRVWFQTDEAFDEVIRHRFLGDYEQAANGQLQPWVETVRSSLALLILLDQFPRNLFRYQPQAYATDGQALEIAEGAIARQFDRQLLPVQRWFVYLPFMHSENLAHQNRAVAIFQELGDEIGDPVAMQAALRHREIIQKFGRFPHRNKILKRESTPEELDFLAQSQFIK
jgi:uncharacterized protein (DUF924 family)